MRNLGDLLLELFVAAIVAIGIAFGVWFICAVLAPSLPADMQDRLRCPRCHFVSNPENFKLRPLDELLQGSRTDCGRDHRPCPCGK